MNVENLEDKEEIDFILKIEIEIINVILEVEMIM